MGFIDGSHKSTKFQTTAGIGGIILDKYKRAVFVFTGPTKAKSPIEAEWLALDFILDAFAKSAFRDKSLILYSDCSKLVYKYLEALI